MKHPKDLVELNQSQRPVASSANRIGHELTVTEKDRQTEREKETYVVNSNPIYLVYGTTRKV